MPFLGRDWRSDGLIWVRTSYGWETLQNWRVKIHENINYTVLQRLLRQSICEPKKSGDLIECAPRPLFLRIPKNSPCRISHGQSTVLFNQAISTLDFAGAFKDGRRANFVFKVMEVLAGDCLLTMTGAVQNQFLALLDQALLSVIETKQNTRRFIELLERILSSLEKNPYGFHHQGGNLQWAKNHQLVEEMLDKAKNITTTERVDDGLTLDQLPHDVIHSILLYLCSQQDLVNAGKTSAEIKAVVADNGLWRDLCRCHFTQQQLRQHLLKRQGKESEVNWYQMYANLHKQYGVKEIYSDQPCWCEPCSTIYWKLTGHPCKHKFITEEEVSPAQFVSMFQV
ncbi:F-box only protein 25-like [Watersipora subatra]|uniref:F-box only protein 25-like n=1 Tax=Watersipora subatra TaxID=2589382 RepID=UPI00355AF0F0